MKSVIFILLAFFLIISCSTEPNINSGWTLQRDKQDNITYYAIHFSDENNGWIVGYSGTIKKTSDGGKTWATQQSDVQSNLWDVSFINAQVGWVCGKDNSILKTVNAGETWNNISSSNPSDKINVELKFIDEDNGWMSNNNGEILKSSDGGESWQVVKENNNGGARLTVFDKNTVYFLSGKLFRTFDGGTSWDSLDVFTPTNYMKSEMFFSDTQNGYITTGNGTGGMVITEFPILITKDSGLSWQVSDYLDQDQLPDVRGISFIDENNGWIAGKNIYKTNNGGKSWTLEYSLKTGISLTKDLYFISQNCGWLLSWNGQIHKYENR